MCSDSGRLCVFFFLILKFDIVVIWNHIANFFQKTKSFCRKSSESGFRLQQHQISKIQKQKHSNVPNIITKTICFWNLKPDSKLLCVFFFQILTFDIVVIWSRIQNFFQKTKSFCEKSSEYGFRLQQYQISKFEKKKHTKVPNHVTDTKQISSSNEATTSLIQATKSCHPMTPRLRWLRVTNLCDVGFVIFKLLSFDECPWQSNITSCVHTKLKSCWWRLQKDVQLWIQCTWRYLDFRFI